MLRDEEWREVDGIIYKEGKICILRDEKLRAEIIWLHHDIPVGGHGGQWKTVELVTRNFWQPGVKKEVKQYVEGTFRRGELPRRFTAKKLFGWLDKRYDKEYWARLERNWRRWKGERARGQRTIETIKEEEEIEQENLGIKEWAEEDNDEMVNICDPYYKL